jgi:dephospho-CoA kinase
VKIGLTGGVGSGKSTVAGLLAEHGAVIVDADKIAREVVEPQTPGYEAVVARFGPGVVGPDGGLDRAALAAIVFADDSARMALNEIVHPLVRRRCDEVAAAAPDGAAVVYDVPLLVEGGATGARDYDAIVVVQANLTARLERLAKRGMSEADARARMAVQASDEQRRAVADELVVNDGSLAELADQVAAVWARLLAHDEPR